MTTDEQLANSPDDLYPGLYLVAAMTRLPLWAISRPDGTYLGSVYARDEDDARARFIEANPA